jgi:F0F1-type ATP synthase assembly protein I
VTGGGQSDHHQPVPPDQEKPPSASPTVAGAFLAMGSTIAICLALGVVLGIYLDRWWGLSPAGLLVGIVLGAAAAVASVISLVKRFL